MSELTLETEQSLRAQMRELTRGIIEKSYAAEMDVEFLTKGRVKTVVDRGDYPSHTSPRYELSGIDKSGKVRLMLMMTTSGHDTAARDGMTPEQMARAEYQREARVFGWSLNDTYSIDVTNLDNSGRTRIVSNAPSRDVTTLQEIEVTLVPGQIIKVKYERGGSAGADAYAEARVIEIVWNGR